LLLHFSAVFHTTNDIQSLSSTQNTRFATCQSPKSSSASPVQNLPLADSAQHFRDPRNLQEGVSFLVWGDQRHQVADSILNCLLDDHLVLKLAQPPCDSFASGAAMIIKIHGVCSSIGPFYLSLDAPPGLLGQTSQYPVSIFALHITNLNRQVKLSSLLKTWA